MNLRFNLTRLLGEVEKDRRPVRTVHTDTQTSSSAITGTGPQRAQSPIGCSLRRRWPHSDQSAVRVKFTQNKQQQKQKKRGHIKTKVTKNNRYRNFKTSGSYSKMQKNTLKKQKLISNIIKKKFYITETSLNISK